MMIDNIGRNLLAAEPIYFMLVPNSKVDFCEMAKQVYNADACDNIVLTECVHDDRTTKLDT